ncbi:P-loop containing nucleoside triphosphate hydrolase protein [Westerdykella ornata]|uniref:P-loop containing nucleoside triphosphate hydrolase protein n=1 Tax=Westerdykella ornata TaxID=318751 RepID=A0A6A6JV31_WESOR|nr:P-loop containing nucleoside triphosphate hydrolase protein [Westerdykella ornata]KAF2279953.1 P-loop containing nucleoside triphosphate hydrolase protein [Westerdykella ornata]
MVIGKMPFNARAFSRAHQRLVNSAPDRNAEPNNEELTENERSAHEKRFLIPFTSKIHSGRTVFDKVVTTQHDHASSTTRRKRKRSHKDDFIKNLPDDDEREERWKLQPFEEGDLPPRPGPGLLTYKDGTMVLVHEWLGKERDEMIELLHNPERCQKIASLPHLDPHCRLHPWQQTGAWKSFVSCQGPMRGVMNVSKMGTGKTRETLVMLEYARTVAKVPGSFDLVLTPRSCIGQWVQEVEQTFAPGKRPRVFVLRNPRTTAGDLLRFDADIVITTYHFLFKQAWRLKKYLNYIRLIQEVGSEKALQLAKEKRWPAERPILSLYSAIFKGNPFRHVVCDEAHMVKNSHGKHHKAIRALFYNAIVLITGTPFPNRLFDGFAYIDLLPNEPFHGVEDIERIFGNDEFHTGLGTLQPTRLARFTKFFMSFSYGNTNEQLKLPPCKQEQVLFTLNEEIEVRVAFYVQRIVDMISRAERSLSSIGQEGEHSEIMQMISKARSLAFVDSFVTEETPERIGMMKQTMQRLRKIHREQLKKTPEESSEDLPEWAHIGKELLQRMEASEPVSHHELLAFTESYMDWAKDKDVISERKQFVEELQRKGIEIPKVARMKKKKNTTSSRKRLNANTDDDGSDVEDEAEEEIAQMDMSEVLLRDEVRDEPKSGKKSSKEAEKRATFKKELAASDLNDLVSERVAAVIQKFNEIRAAHPEDKIIIWSTSVKFLDVLAEVLSRDESGRAGVNCYQFDGKLDDIERSVTLKDFKEAPPSRPLLTSTGAGGNGLNLTCANQVILCEPLWNAQDEQQVIDRCHRQPQAKTVYVYRIFGANSAIDIMTEKAKRRKWAQIKPVMEQLRRSEGVKLRIPKIAKWYCSLRDLSLDE